MPARSNFRADPETPERDNAVGDGRRPPRLQLTPAERAQLPVDALAALVPLLNRDPSTWEPSEEQLVTVALDRANGDEAVAMVRARVAALSPSARAQRDTWRPLVEEYNRVNGDLVAAKVRPTSDTYSRRRARMWVDGLKREAGVAAMEAEREVWRASPGNPRSTMAIQAARERAEAEVEQQRPTLEDLARSEFETDRRRDSDAKFNERANRKRDLRHQLQTAGVPVPEDPRELTTP